jgi:hypothetical protein
VSADDSCQEFWMPLQGVNLEFITAGISADDPCTVLVKGPHFLPLAANSSGVSASVLACSTKEVVGPWSASYTFRDCFPLSESSFSVTLAKGIVVKAIKRSAPGQVFGGFNSGFALTSRGMFGLVWCQQSLNRVSAVSTYNRATRFLDC